MRDHGVEVDLERRHGLEVPVGRHERVDVADPADDLLSDVHRGTAAGMQERLRRGCERPLHPQRGQDRLEVSLRREHVAGDERGERVVLVGQRLAGTREVHAAGLEDPRDALPARGVVACDVEQ